MSISSHYPGSASSRSSGKTAGTIYCSKRQYSAQMRLGAPGDYKSMLIFYVDKRERMIVFMDVVAVLTRVVAEANRRAW